jgi:hypothetical protein
MDVAFQAALSIVSLSTGTNGGSRPLSFFDIMNVFRFAPAIRALTDSKKRCRLSVQCPRRHPPAKKAPTEFAGSVGK